MLSLVFLKYPAFFVSLKDLTLPLYKHVEWPSEFSNIPPLEQEVQNGCLTDGAALCTWGVHAAFSMLSKPASTVAVSLLIFVFYPMPQSDADMLLYRMVSSVLASREEEEQGISQGHSPMETLYYLIWGNTAVFQMKY